MESDLGSYYKITRDELNEFAGPVDAVLKDVKWKPSRASLSPQRVSRMESIRNVLSGEQEQNISFAHFAVNFGQSGFAMPEGINKTYLVLRDALMLGHCLSKLYDKASNLDVIRNEKNMPHDRQLELRQKSNTSAAVLAFVAAYYVIHELSQYRSDMTESLPMDFEGIPELDLANPFAARNSMLFYYGAYLKHSGRVHTEFDFVKLTLLYFQGIVDEIKTKEDALEHVEFFESKQYKLADSDFTVAGFELTLPGKVRSMDFNRVQWEEIVGNIASKHSARRTIQALLCYDPASKRNAMADLGGFVMTKLTYGPPGTGKSMEIAAIATELDERCRALDIPFLFTPFPDNIVSTYQGGSAERALSWFKPMQDPERIVFAPIDDAENNLTERSGQGVSAGVQEVIGVFLRMTEGAYSVMGQRGNVLINLYTNLPEKIDKAVLSRVQGRTFMGGAERYEDFLDQDYIGLIRKFEDLAPGFIDLRADDNYKYMSAQSVEKGIAEAYGERREVRNDKIATILEQIKSDYDPSSHAFFARLDVAIKAQFPGYTSRDKRNIQSAVKTRVLDFDFPAEWMDDAGVFYRQDYDSKRGMLIEVMRDNLKGRSFADILLEETLFYFENMVTITDRDFERRVADLLAQMRVQDVARQRYGQG